MDKLTRMALFTRVVERQSFAAAAGDMGIARSTATTAIKEMEADLATRLLERTTRHVTTTQEGEAYYHRCRAILAEIEEAEGNMRGDRARGLLRIDANGLMTRRFLLPQLPEFLARHPDLRIQFGQSDRMVDLVREGIDCVLRVGAPEDSGMIRRPLAQLSEVTCASPAYLARHGTPDSPDALAGHLMVGFLSSRTGDVMPLEFTEAGRLRHITLPSRVTSNDSATAADLALAGFGLYQAPRYRFAEELASGRLVEILPDHAPQPSPLNAIYPQNRQLSQRLRVFLDWAGGIFARAAL